VPGTVRLTARFEVGEDGKGPSAPELQRELEALAQDLNALVGPPIAAAPLGRSDRELTELVETYRPRQRELVDLLRDEGELTQGEHSRLVEYLASPTAAPTRPISAALPAETERLIATVPIERSAPVTPSVPAKPGEPSRPVPELLRTYQISNLRQAGAVRARRQISFAEYMALKRHFEEEDRPRDVRAAD
jgi:hypothetical protein